MNDDTSPEQLLSRILRVAKLLTYMETPLHNTVTMDQYIEHDSAPIIVAKDNSGENLEKLRERKKM